MVDPAFAAASMLGTSVLNLGCPPMGIPDCVPQASGGPLNPPKGPWPQHDEQDKIAVTSTV